MHLEAVGLSKQLATSLTLVGKDTRVFSRVSLETSGVDERCIAVFTLVRSLTSVAHSVLPQGT